MMTCLRTVLSPRKVLTVYISFVRLSAREASSNYTTYYLKFHRIFDKVNSIPLWSYVQSTYAVNFNPFASIVSTKRIFPQLALRAACRERLHLY